jgi:hypothetical protein
VKEELAKSKARVGPIKDTVPYLRDPIAWSVLPPSHRGSRRSSSAALVTSGIDYDIAPDPIDGIIVARDLTGWAELIASGIEESELLFDFSRLEEVEFP